MHHPTLEILSLPMSWCLPISHAVKTVFVNLLLQLLVAKKIPSIRKSSIRKDSLCILDEHLDDDCICCIKLAEGLNVDGVLESWGKVKPVSWKLGMKKLEMIGLKRT
ncbi:hypothetical protein IGI04_022597 [Brassica rapa subsp. trilocularis]|uniref:Uncharacterized protein n=1 Tax=Brassica rapa subsp. trilocularis TaxID=1813537 RepID=A0ABQ7M1G6_BRACM|nr:hypothetical protein IGI04_022597 [Brassica rapa subsp. trilocularis]